MDKRAAFEAWRAERYAQTTSWCNELGEYPDEFTQGQWKAWKGALAAQPDPNVRYGDGFHDGYLKGREEGWDAALAAQPAASVHPIPQRLREAFSAIEDAAHSVSGMQVFTQMRTAVQSFFQAQPAASADPEKYKTDDELGGVLAAIRHYGGQKWAEGRGVADDDLQNVRNAWAAVYERVQALAAHKPGGGEVEVVLHQFLTEDGFIAECDIPHIVHALTAKKGESNE